MISMCGILEAGKALANISHYVLFMELIARLVPAGLVKVLCYWYQNQSMYLRWVQQFLCWSKHPCRFINKVNKNIYNI